MSQTWNKEVDADAIYLPAGNLYNENNDGVPIDEEIQNYIKREFPFPTEGCSEIRRYSIPNKFIRHGEPQGSQAEFETYKCFHNVELPQNKTVTSRLLWLACFQGITYAGRSHRNSREGRLMTREHDLVVFTTYNNEYFVSLIEVKSTCDDPSLGYKISDSQSVKNNKRSGQHQLRDHLEILKSFCDVSLDNLQCYLFWPFLKAWTKDCRGQDMKRWEKESDQHVFVDVVSNQDAFNDWFYGNVLKGKSIEKNVFDMLFKRFIVLSCGILVNEIRSGLLALLSQEQLELLYTKPSESESPTIVHGAAGTGKTLLILHRLRFLYECGLLNDNNRALYICYWPGIRTDFCIKLKKLGIDGYVDTIRFAISRDGVLKTLKSKYRHIYMDECEAICLAFEENIVSTTFNDIENCRLITNDKKYDILKNKFDKNYLKNCHNVNVMNLDFKEYNNNVTVTVYGDLWYMVDINQATLFMPKHSPEILKTPTVRLTKVIRNTETIFRTFNSFYKNPLPCVPAAVKLSDLYLNNIEIGHKIKGPPIFWVNTDDLSEDSDIPGVSSTKAFNGLIRVILDLFSSKGIKPKDICVLPFIITDVYLTDNINKAITSQFVTNSVYHPIAYTYVEEFLTNNNPLEFLVPWVLRVKGLEFKVVIIVIENEDFDCSDPEDRRKIYVMASRCTCLLILVSSERIKVCIDDRKEIRPYQFQIDF